MNLLNARTFVATAIVTAAGFSIAAPAFADTAGPGHTPTSTGQCHAQTQGSDNKLVSATGGSGTVTGNGDMQLSNGANDEGWVLCIKPKK